jgi:predicted DCC family thiol-disulfide oxidoreductase YuxK
MTEQNPDTAAPVQVFYDGSCPLCTAEIGYYRQRDTSCAVSFVDVSSDQFSEDERLSRSEAMARFHVRAANGAQMSGARGFVELWRVIPSWRWLFRLTKIPGAVSILEVFYRLFLCLRPLVVRAFGLFQQATEKAKAQ